MAIDRMQELQDAALRLRFTHQAYSTALNEARHAYPELHVGQRLHDGYIVAGMVNGQWFAVAPADRRYVAKWDEAMERDTLPDFDQLMAIYANRELIDAADTSGGTNTLAAIGESDETHYAWSSTETSSYRARIVRLSDGYQYSGIKSNECWVVPVRKMGLGVV